MIGAIRKLLRPREAVPLPSVPQGQRVYAVGDIHGRLDLLRALAAAIAEDDAARNRRHMAHTTEILLGDLVDRGPESAGVIGFARAWQQQRGLRILAGNHEEMLLGGIDSVDVLRHLLRHGGRETVLSFGIDEARYESATYEEIQALMRSLIPPEDLAFIAGFENQIRIGDYLFVHAGIRPGVPHEDQTPADLRWIREPFLSHQSSHGAVVVHGHTITDSAVIAPNRIGIDTGAYASGRLTALGLEGAARWLIATEVDENGAINITKQTIAP